MTGERPFASVEGGASDRLEALTNWLIGFTVLLVVFTIAAVVFTAVVAARG